MCGIAGLVQTGASPNNLDLDLNCINQMLTTIQHRGPDDYGISCFGYGQNGKRDKLDLYSEQPGNSTVILGHRRLSIIDLSEHGRQPISSNDENLHLIFNGELYNYQELKEELKPNYEFKTATDTEVVLAAYEKWGAKMLSRFDGMFAMALLDRKNSTLFCARDIAGIKPFYYSNKNGRFLFGSEPKVILKGLGQNGTFDQAHLSEFLLFGISDYDEGTFYREVQQLRGGWTLTLDLKNGQIQKEQFYHLPKQQTDVTFTEKEVLENFQSAMHTAVKRQLRADVLVGSSLSGGIDSGAVATTIGELLHEDSSNYTALTFSFPGFPNDESIFAKRIAETSGLKWEPVVPSLESMEKDLTNMLINMGEPFGTLSMFAQYKVMEHANKIGLTVMLDGQGGDEVYLGYPRIANRVPSTYFRKGKIGKGLQEVKGLKNNLSQSYLFQLLSGLYFNSKNLALRKKKKEVSKFVDLDYLKGFRNEIADDLFSRKSIDQKQRDEFSKYILPRLLRYADRNSMAFGIESRVPHLSVLMLENVFPLPLCWKVRNGWTKYIARKSFSDKMPSEVIWNTKKLGFDIPQAYWIEKLRPLLKTWIQSLGEDNPFKKEQILHSLETNPGDKNLWPVLSVIGLIHHQKTSI